MAALLLLSSSTTNSSIHLLFHSTLVTITPPPCNCTNINFIQTSRVPSIRGKFYPKFFVVTPSNSQVGNWEDPESSDSESGEEDEMEENNLDYESDWEEEKDDVETSINMESLSTSQIEEDLRKEVEQLLSPEERAILLQNKTPNLDKISMEKWNPLHTLGLAGQIKFMDSLLGNGFDIDVADKDGQTALHKAVLGKKRGCHQPPFKKRCKSSCPRSGNIKIIGCMQGGIFSGGSHLGRFVTRYMFETNFGCFGEARTYLGHFGNPWRCVYGHGSFYVVTFGANIRT